MLNSKAVFADNLRSAREQSGLYAFLSASVTSPVSFDDLLRAQIVYSVSAFDKLIHDVIRKGLIEIYLGRRTSTPSYLSEPISLELHSAIVNATIPPAEVLFEQEMIKKLRLMSFQSPENVAKGLSLIWPVKHKWQVIASKMNLPKTVVETTMKLISVRRNAIVHEADIDPVSGLRTTISLSETNDVTDFLENCGNQIADLVQ